MRQRIIEQGEEVPIEEACAMTTRVSPSFIRVGHFDLFGRCIQLFIPFIVVMKIMMMMMRMIITIMTIIMAIIMNLNAETLTQKLCQRVSSVSAFLLLLGALVRLERPRTKPAPWRSYASCKQLLVDLPTGTHSRVFAFSLVFALCSAEHALFREYSDGDDPQAPLQKVTG